MKERSAPNNPQDESGSVLLLALGYFVLALVVILVCIEATSLYLAQKRLDGLADAAALAAADGFTLAVTDGDEPVATLTADLVYAEASTLLTLVGAEATLVSATTTDGTSARVVVTDTWHPGMLALFIPSGVVLEATATSRTALN